MTASLTLDRPIAPLASDRQGRNSSVRFWLNSWLSAFPATEVKVTGEADSPRRVATPATALFQEQAHRRGSVRDGIRNQ